MGVNIQLLKRMYQITHDMKFRFLLVGSWNALFAYLSAVGIYYLLNRYVGLFFVSVISNVIAITMSFTTNKIFVFRLKGHWLREYLRSYVIYGGNLTIGIVGLWYLSGVIGIPVVFAQGFLVMLGVLIAFFGHQKFTFKRHVSK